MNTRDHESSGGFWTGALVTLLVFGALIAVGTWALYAFGADTVDVNGRTLAELQPWEAVLLVVVAIMGLVVAVIVAIAGVLLSLLAAAIALFIGLGVVLGPFLLLGFTVLVIRRRRQTPPKREPVHDLL